jgi:hypothetical protein
MFDWFWRFLSYISVAPSSSVTNANRPNNANTPNNVKTPNNANTPNGIQNNNNLIAASTGKFANAKNANAFQRLPGTVTRQNIARRTAQPVDSLDNVSSKKNVRFNMQNNNLSTKTNNVRDYNIDTSINSSVPNLNVEETSPVPKPQETMSPTLMPMNSRR